MLPLPRSGGGGRTRVRAGVLLCSLLLAVSASVPADKCPRLDCALEGRHFCRAGSSHCGPCLAPLVEDSKGHCVPKMKQALLSKATTLPELDEQIDLLSSIIAKQQEVEGEPTGDRCPELWEHSPARAVGKLQSGSNLTTALPKGGSSEATAMPHPAPRPTEHTGPLILPYPSKDTLFIIMITVCVLVGTIALILAAVCWIRLHKGMRLAQKVDYPAFSSSGSKTSEKKSGDKSLAQSAQMYHYQHQKQQMLSMEKHKDEPKVPESGATSDEENEEGDFTVYECPGLAPTGEMEVKNPLFDDHGLQPQRKYK
ncbi:neural proliferation differentiation and control protein 1-like [Arapaima gigas]